ncbi:MAG: glycosyltransferase family 39 protein [Desulfobulbales bacterium]|nr:glycosyltransferase family 39 protein [Desulfobulbales bacterium]
MHDGQKKYIEHKLLIFSLSPLVVLLLYLNRHLDDNRLTSWNWAFAAVSPPLFTILLILVLGLAILLSGASFYESKRRLGLFVAAFIMSAAFWSEPEVIVDASRYFTQAKHLQLYGVQYWAGQWGREIFAWTDLPLIPFLYGLVFKFFGEQRIFIQVLNTVFYSFTVVLTFQLGKSLWDEDLGYWAGLLLLGFPYLYTQVPLMLVDVPTMFFFMLAVVSCFEALEKGGIGRIGLAAFALVLVFYAKYSTWMLLTLIPVMCVYFLLLRPAATLKRGALLALLALFFIGAIFLFYRDIFIPQLKFLFAYQKPGLKRWSESYVSTFIFQTHPFISAAAVISFLAAARKMDFKYIIVSFLVLLFLVLQVKRIRYTIPVFPMLALMAAYGIKELQNRALIKQVVFSVVGTSFIIAYLGFLPFLQTLGVQNLQAAGLYLNTLALTNVEVVNQTGENAVINPDINIPVLDIYTQKKVLYKAGSSGPETLEKTQKSPLRFTWEFPLPRYYRPQTEESVEGVVIISDDLSHLPPKDLEDTISRYPAKKFFRQSSNIFQHQTFVAVYHK